jgi:hypothetical protein
MFGYTRSNVRALVEAILPRTPELADRHGEAIVPGGRDVGLEEYVIESFNSYQELHLGPLTPLARRLGVRNYPYAVIVALLLDVVALELLVRRGNERPVRKATLASPFARLEPRDRLRALALLETGALDSLAGRVEHRLPVVGTVRFLALGVNAFPLLGYYSEWPGETPASNPGWRQCGYPGPAEGYSEHMGYEVESFSEFEPDEWDPETLDTGDWDPDSFEEWPPDSFADVGTTPGETDDPDPSPEPRPDEGPGGDDSEPDSDEESDGGLSESGPDGVPGGGESGPDSDEASGGDASARGGTPTGEGR